AQRRVLLGSGSKPDLRRAPAARRRRARTEARGEAVATTGQAALPDHEGRTGGAARLAGRPGRSRAGAQRPAAQALLRRARRLRLDARPRPRPAARRRAVEGRADRHRGANAEDAGGPVPGSDAPLRTRVRRCPDPLGGLGGTEAVVKIVLVLATALLLATS